uniref:Uncharacterized protein n=1 Tax=Candidatus Kentrum sp. MB TaxID=2138164 RepID=A0A450XLI2_9GAMM|nr:MAG: hypothetical protein BECKMB1821I_GA0114274_10149 [Candidatus Kentron sp. MB]VFK75128.1 MAG: hypothetical protein BECKMB1821H_GA0114242_10169 [Candidatus Kentron sp. MB]
MVLQQAKLSCIYMCILSLDIGGIYQTQGAVFVGYCLRKQTTGLISDLLRLIRFFFER